MLVYTDRAQCEYFNAPYYDAGRLVVAADTLLKSKKGDGYDTKHTEYLSSFGSKTLLLVRDENTAPGWWKVERAV